MIPLNREICLKKDLGFFGSGTGGPGKFREISNFYSAEKSLNLEESCVLILSSAIEILNKINNNLEIVPYLSETPYPIKNICVIISFFDKKNNKLIGENQISIVALINGNLIYYLYDKEINKDKEFFRESAEEALEKIKSNR